MIEVTEETRFPAKRYRVQIRRGEGWKVKPEAEPLDGKVFTFLAGWPLEEGDTSIYVGEWAMMFREDVEFWKQYPDAPGWIASGDLVEVGSEGRGK